MNEPTPDRPPARLDGEGEWVGSRPTCSCPHVYAGHDRVGTNWSERCPTHGIGTDWFDRHEGPDGTTMRTRYEAFRRRVFPTLPASWTAEDDL